MSKTTLPARVEPTPPGGLQPTGDPESPLALASPLFDQMSRTAVSAKVDKVLRAPAKATAEIDILPTGEVYMSHVHMRRRLNDAFGPMGWGLRPLSKISHDPQTHDMYREYALVANGSVVAVAVGSTKYHPNNERMDFADAAEAVRSNALTRCCKDLGIGSECWDRQWCEDWKDKHAVHVAVTVRRWDRNAQAYKEETKGQWRRITAKPFYKELDIMADSPNYERWQKQRKAWQAERDARRREKRADVVEDDPVPSGGGESSRARAAAPPRNVTPAREPERPRSTADNTTPAATTIKPADRGFYIRQMTASRDQRIPHRIVMRDGTEYCTYHKSYFDELSKIFAAQQKVKIFTETKVDARGQRHVHVHEWQVLDA
jgi:hypothetical protein